VQNIQYIHIKGSYLVVSHLLNPRTKIELTMPRVKHSGDRKPWLHARANILLVKKIKIKITSWTWRVSRAKVMKAKYNDIS